MLPTDIKNCYLNNKEVQSLWLGGKEIWTLAKEPSNNPFDLYTPAEIQAMIQNGTVEQYFKIGDILTVSGSYTTTYTGLDELQYMIVDFEYNGLPTMVLMGITNYGYTSWHTKSTSSTRSYTSSQPFSKAHHFLYALRDNGLYDIAVTRTCSFVSGNTSSSSTATNCVIPSLTEIAGTGHGQSYQEFGTQLRYYREGGDYAFNGYVWTRERDLNYTGRICTFYKLGGYSDLSAVNTSYCAYTTALIFLG